MAYVCLAMTPGTPPGVRRRGRMRMKVRSLTAVANSRIRSGRRRPGGILVYTIIALTALVGVCSLAVDWGRVQMVKTELQRTADVSAGGYLGIYQTYGSTYADSYGP